MPGFVELEDQEGRSINVGDWRERTDGHAELVVDLGPMMEAIGACREFIRRVEEGSIRSQRTYAAMKRIIADFDATGFSVEKAG